MLAGFGTALGHLARQQRVVPRQQGAHAARAGLHLDQADQQAQRLARRGREQGVEQLFDALGAGAQLVGLEDDIDRDAMLFEVAGNARRGQPAGVEQCAQHVGVLSHQGGVARGQGRGQVVGAARQLAEGVVGQQRAVHAQAQRCGESRRAHGAHQVVQGFEQARLPAHAAAFGSEQVRGAFKRGVVQRRQPAQVGVFEQQREQRGQIARDRRARQQPVAQALPQRAAQGQPRREAELGEQRGDVDLAPEGLQQALHGVAVLRVLVEHLQQLPQPQHRPRRGTLGARPAVAQPLHQPGQPEVALGQRGARIGGVEQGRQVPRRRRHGDQ